MYHFFILSTASVDFVPFVEDVVTFEPGSTETCHPLIVTQDNLVEGDEFLTVTIVRADVTLGAITTSQVEIQDSDSEFSYTCTYLMTTLRFVYESVYGKICWIYYSQSYPSIFFYI